MNHVNMRTNEMRVHSLRLAPMLAMFSLAAHVEDRVDEPIWQVSRAADARALCWAVSGVLRGWACEDMGVVSWACGGEGGTEGSPLSSCSDALARGVIRGCGGRVCPTRARPVSR